MQTGEAISKELLERPVAGLNLMPGTFGDQLVSTAIDGGRETSSGAEEPLTLLVFLRHFGCIFCRETLADMRAHCESDARFPEPLFVFEGRAAEGRAFLRTLWPSVRAIADPDATLYDGFGVGRGGVIDMFRPAVFRAQSAARKKGLRNGERAGDVWRMPGIFLLRGARILWRHHYRHAADHPDYDEIGHLAAVAGRVESA